MPMSLQQDLSFRYPEAMKNKICLLGLKQKEKVDDKTSSILLTSSGKVVDENPDYCSLFTKTDFARESLQVFLQVYK